MPVAPLTLICLSLATALVALAPIILYRRLAKPFALDWRDTVAGIAVFALFATVIERALNGYVLRADGPAAAWLANPVAFVAYGALVAGVCEEVGRYLAMRMLNGRSGARRNAPVDSTGLGYGIGHGGAEAWLVGVLVQVQWITFAVLANRGELDSHLTNLSVDAVLRVHLILATLSPQFAGVFVIERIAALVFQLGLSVLMWRGVRAGSKTILPVAIAAHALIDLPAAMYQARLVSLTVVDGVYVAAAILVAIALFRACRSNRPIARAA
ncbi:putative membrane protein YhfC [Paraburkholderia caballeronis]|uniref:YhfC family intramembrane metalloprotease n=1 Tax=Paraburkholderia caballeronis TaxID=416943 RepID=UPI001066A585|nr:YhfC family intramembrane metalloprotease [Paraburkholderia caballeronis]TDV37905.1 putative membrane protein YhfC [Paraburkholderia caballeronis]